MYSLKATLADMGVLSAQFEYPLVELGLTDKEIDSLRQAIALAILNASRADIVDDYLPR